MKKNASARFTEFLGSWVTPTLRSAGFKKRGMTYRKDLDECSWLANIQRSRWNSDGIIRFTLNIGVYVPGVFSMFSGLEERKNATIADCAVYVRAGFLTSARGDTWWTLTSSDKENSNDEFVGQEVTTVLSEDSLTFLQKFQSIHEIAEFLEKIAESDDRGFFPPDSAQRYCYAAILYSMCGEEKRIDPLMAHAIEKSAGTPNADIFVGVKDRIS